MNTSGPLTRTAEFRALPGQGDLLADRLLYAASLPGDGEMINGTDDR